MMLNILSTYLLGCRRLGVIDASTVLKVVKEVTAEEKKRQVALAARPPVENILNLHDFEVSANALRLNGMLNPSM